MTDYISSVKIDGTDVSIKDKETSDKLNNHINANNPHNITKSTIGLGNVDNTKDSEKSVLHAKTADSLTGGGTGITLDQVYPVGSIYMSTNSTSPHTLFGGTWEQIYGKFLLSAGSGYRAGTTGGEAKHALTTAEMPVHTHTIPQHLHDIRELDLYGIQIQQERQVTSDSPGLYINSQVGSHITHKGMVPFRAGTTLSPGNEWVHTDLGRTEYAPETNTGSTGSGQAFSTMPPYLVVNVWQRTA